MILKLAADNCAAPQWVLMDSIKQIGYVKERIRKSELQSYLIDCYNSYISFDKGWSNDPLEGTEEPNTEDYFFHKYICIINLVMKDNTPLVIRTEYEAFVLSEENGKTIERLN